MFYRGEMRKVSEAADNYPDIVAMLGDGRRVIECAAGVQWIIQQRLRETRYPWEGQSFCRTKEALIRLAGSHPTLMALPDHFQRSQIHTSLAGESDFEGGLIVGPETVPNPLSPAPFAPGKSSPPIPAAKTQRRTKTKDVPINKCASELVPKVHIPPNWGPK
jgi:hypothetical protein